MQGTKPQSDSTLLSRLRLFVIVGVAGLLVLFVLAFSVLRLALPLLTDYGQEIEARLTEELGKPVHIGRIDADWYWFTPRLKLDDVAIFDESQEKKIIHFREVYFSFEWWQNLFRLNFHPRQVTLIGGQFNIIRHTADIFEIQGFEIDTRSERQSNDNPLYGLLSHTTYHLLDTSVHWRDKLVDDKLQVWSHLNLSLRNNDPVHRLLVDVMLPEKLGQQLLLIAELQRGTNWLDWHGQLYLKADGFKPQWLFDYLDQELVDTSLGDVNLELWADLTDNRIDAISGHIATDQLIFRNKQTAQDVDLSWRADNLSADFKLRKNTNRWQLSVNRFNLQHNASQWRDTQFDLQYDLENNSLAMAADYLRLDDMADLSRVLVNQPGLQNLLDRYNPHGTLTNFSMYVPDVKQPESIQLRSAFTGMGFNLPEQQLSMENVDGNLQLNNQSGTLRLDSQQILMQTKIYQMPLVLNQIKADIEFEQQGDNILLSTDNARVDLDTVTTLSRFNLQLGAQSSVDAQLHLEQADAGWFNRYLPDQLLQEKLSDWLHMAIVRGDFKSGDVLLYGDLSEFPFLHQQGVLQAQIDIDNAVFQYQRDWPPVVDLEGLFQYNDHQITLSGASGRIDQNQIRETVANMALFNEPIVKIQGQIEAQAQNVSSFFDQTPLKQRADKILRHVDASGLVFVQLGLDIPLSGEGRVDVQGAVNLDQNGLVVKQLGYAVDTITGEVTFHNENISASGLRGQYNNEILRADIRTEDQGTYQQTTVTMDVAAGFEDLVKTDLQLSHLYKNKPGWLIDVHFNHSGQVDGASLEVKANSDLVNTALLLPPPFNKAQGDSRPLSVNLKHFDDYTYILLAYDADLHGVFSWSTVTESLRGDIRFDQGPAILPEQGITLSARLPQLVLDPWINLVEQQQGNDSDAGVVKQLKSIRLDTQQLVYKDKQFDQVRLDAEHLGYNWVVQVDAPMLKGRGIVDDDFAFNKPLKLELQYLDLGFFAANEDETATQVSSSPPDSILPTQIPALKVTAEQLKYKHYKFRDASLETSRGRHGMVVHRAELHGPQLSLQAKGSWLSTRAKPHNSVFRVELTSQNVGEMLSSMQFTESIDQGDGHVILDWQWPAPPHQFNWALLSGKADIRIEDGAFKDVEPGAGRLLGMFSLNVLPKRLLLDFSDTFGKGFKFESLVASASFANGNLYTRDAHIKGASADIYFNGRTGLAQKDFDQVMTVVPHVSSGISGWLAVLQGVSVGAAAYIGQKLFGVDEAAKQEYQITGNWDDPVITDLKKPQEKALENTQNK